MIEGEVVVELDELSSFPEEERVFLRFMSTLIDKHKLDTPDFIKRHIRAFEAFGATEMAEFWRDALAAYGQAFDAAVADHERCAERHLKLVN